MKAQPLTLEQRLTNQIGVLVFENARLATSMDQANAVIVALKEEISTLKAEVSQANDTLIAAE